MSFFSNWLIGSNFLTFTNFYFYQLIVEPSGLLRLKISGLLHSGASLGLISMISLLTGYFNGVPSNGLLHRGLLGLFQL